VSIVEMLENVAAAPPGYTRARPHQPGEGHAMQGAGICPWSEFCNNAGAHHQSDQPSFRRQHYRMFLHFGLD
jgi:hypothetical protein